MNTLPSCSDYATSICVNELVKAPKLSGGYPVTYNGKPIKYVGGFCVVFPYCVGNKKYAVRCMHSDVLDIMDRSRIISQSLKKLNLPYFVDFEYVENGIATPMGVQPVVIMDWVDAKTLKGYIEDNLTDSDALKELADAFLNMTHDLHKHNISHGDMQHDNIMVKSDGSIVLVDYDSMYVPELDGRPDAICGLSGFQHPARWSNKSLSPKADYFSEMVIYLTLIALAEDPSLWYDLKMKDSESLLFSKEDIDSKGSAPIFQRLESMDTCRDVLKQLVDSFDCKTIDDIPPMNVRRTTIVDFLSSLWKNKPKVASKAFDVSEVSRIASLW